MGAEHVVGARGIVRVEVTAVDVGASTATVRVLNNNDAMVGTPSTLPMGMVTIQASPVAAGDVLECLRDDGQFRHGAYLVARFVDPADPTRWSFVPEGTPLLSSSGWRKIGTFAAP